MQKEASKQMKTEEGIKGAIIVYKLPENENEDPKKYKSLWKNKKDN